MYIQFTVHRRSYVLLLPILYAVLRGYNFIKYSKIVLEIIKTVPEIKINYIFQTYTMCMVYEIDLIIQIVNVLIVKTI